MKRSIVLQFNDGSDDVELEIGKANLLNLINEFIYIEKMKDGTWRLTSTKEVIDDFSKLDCLKFIRED